MDACRTKFVRLSENYESETRDAQVDGSLLWNDPGEIIS